MSDHCSKNEPRPYGTSLIEPACWKSCASMMMPNLCGVQLFILSWNEGNPEQSTVDRQHLPSLVLPKPYLMALLVAFD